LSEEEKKADQARSELQRYMHYFQRFQNHANSVKFAMKTLEEAERTVAVFEVSHGIRENEAPARSQGSRVE
jgi:hypothetical protein